MLADSEQLTRTSRGGGQWAEREGQWLVTSALPEEDVHFFIILFHSASSLSP